ncbi:tripartite motif-containing protein 3-like [Branchiostoma lanceolatum]|uniref:tripartite motif-containing protein 3-like n=1 Tax=Branchiostoma lanceolatum TaxID=7740 RepID=UPI003456AD27
MAAAPSALMGQIHEELTCSICLELFTRPKVLPCQHTFCQDCLQDHAERGEPFQCPNCRREIKLPPEGVASIPYNHLVSSLCARLQGQATLPGETKEQPKAGNRCSFHPWEVLHLYCMQCQIPVCNKCFEEGHEGHPTTNLKKAPQERRSTVQGLINGGRDNLELYCSYMRSLREKENTLNERKKQTENGIIQAYNQMVLRLTERKDHLLSEAEQSHRENLDMLQNGRDKVLSDIGELSAACDQAEQEMKQEGVGFPSQETILVIAKYREKAAPTPVQTQPVVFQPTDTPVPVLGHVAVPSLLPAPMSAVPASSDVTTMVTAHRHGNQWQGGHPYHRVKFGGRGLETGEFGTDLTVTVSDEGELFVADSENHRVQVFTLQGTFVRQFPTEFGAQKIRLSDVTMDGEGNLWALAGPLPDGTKTYRPMQFAVQYTKEGRVVRKFKLVNFCSRVAVNTISNHILCLGVNVDVYRPNGTLLRTICLQQVIEEQMTRQQQSPYGNFLSLTVDQEGNILVSCCQSNCVFISSVDGQFQFHFGVEGSGEGEMKGPHGICTDSSGNIIVADCYNRRVEMFDKTGTFIKHMTTDMTMPSEVAMSTQGHLVVTDREKLTVNIFSDFHM